MQQGFAVIAAFLLHCRLSASLPWKRQSPYAPKLIPFHNVDENSLPRISVDTPKHEPAIQKFGT